MADDNSEISDNASNPPQQATAAAENLLKATISPQIQLITAQLEEDNNLLWKV